MKKGLSLIIVLLLTGILSLVFISGCAKEQERIKIVTSFPMRGVSYGVNSVKAIELALEEADYQVGDYKIELVVRDDSDNEGNFKEDLERDIVNEAVADPDVMIYLGPGSSDAAKVSIPITNMAGLVQISSGNTWPGLTMPGFEPGEPGIFYPTGVRNYFRTVPTDAFQGVVGAKWAKELGLKNIYILNDGGTYGAGISKIFRDKADEIGLNIVGSESIDFSNIGDVSAKISLLKDLSIDLVYLGITSANIPRVLIELDEQGLSMKKMGPDSIMSEAVLGLENTEELYITSIGLPISMIEESGFVKNYNKKYGVNPPTIWPAFAYDAAKVSLLAIERAGKKDRTKILEEMSKIKDYEGVFGTWSFDENGDTTLTLISGNTVKDGEFVFDKVLIVR